MDVVTADRLQFAFTIMFHYLFPITTIGLAPFVAMYTIEAARGDRDAARAATFWTRIFARQLRGWCRNRHSDGIPVRDELGGVLGGGRLGHRSAAGDGRYVRILSRVDLPRRPAVGQRPCGAVALFDVRRCGMGGLVALGLFHRRDGCMDAAPSRLHDRVNRQDRTRELAGNAALVLCLVAIRARVVRRNGCRELRRGGCRRVLPALEPRDGLGATFR